MVGIGWTSIPVEAGEATPTYARDVAPILRANCRECHRPGQVAPFSLETYEQARKRAGDIASVVEERRMPPWKPTPGIGPKLKHERSLPPREVALLRAWADAGAPRGPERDQAIEPSFADGWKLGTPDVVLEPSEDFAVPASGPDLYRCFVIPTNLSDDVYVSAVEYRPGNRRVVHHLMAFIEVAGLGRQRDEAEPGPGYTSYSVGSRSSATSAAGRPVTSPATCPKESAGRSRAGLTSSCKSITTPTAGPRLTGRRLASTCLASRFARRSSGRA